MKTGLLIALLFVVRSATVSAQSSPDCHGDSVVKKVSLENATALSSKQRTSLNRLLLGRCLDHNDGGPLGHAVYHQLQEFGYKRVYVQDPIVRVLGRSRHPFPVAITIDFVVTAPERSGCHHPGCMYLLAPAGGQEQY
jgi:hypothetical protein